MSLAPAAQAQAQQTGAEAPSGPPVRPTLSGCRVALPGGADMDSGLAGQYLEDSQGAPFLVAPSLTLRQTYTDNVTLAPDSDKESDFVTQLIPSLSLCRVGPRLRTQVDYQATANYYWNDQDRNDIYHTLNADSTATLVRNRLFVDLGALYEQQTISNRGAFADDLALDTGNRSDAITLRASPYLVQDLGPLGNSVTRVGVRRTVYDEDIPNITRQSGSFQLVSPEAADPVSWLASVQSERVERSNIDRSQYFDNAFLELGYRLTGRLQLIGRGGAETESRADGTQDRFGAEYWEAGFRWTDVRTSIEARYGRRFFGDTYFAAITRRGSRLTSSLSYRETQQISDRFVVLSPEDLGLPSQIVDPDTGEVFDLPGFIVEDNEVFVSKRATANTTYRTGRSTIRLTAFHDRREFQVAEDEEERYGADAYWRWQWLPRTAVIPRVSWERIDFRDDRSDTIRGARISLAHLIGRKTQAGATIRRQERTSNESGNDYTENAIILEATRMF
ncbi:uncharacterized protein (PEP-CTERM system associated) [Natronocella acetinitrilica]|uniref:Uncharacterized protein (PEP-CTERM system associated) n=1 Tax=Natronocella acetinitrilica TaxID=414046 RepID=A0AAE3G8T3_9GAMM|nr:TIGR03016 family PEP-CTERM system-associated outer membrane protein [Natronocella acetinitrilica]MCP1677138.1 uncharacterized protein (PEP-CTERM system associated) [Natronocella acetinitrilica]